MSIRCRGTVDSANEAESVLPSQRVARRGCQRQGEEAHPAVDQQGHGEVSDSSWDLSHCPVSSCFLLLWLCSTVLGGRRLPPSSPLCAARGSRSLYHILLTALQPAGHFLEVAPLLRHPATSVPQPKPRDKLLPERERADL